MNTNNKFVPYFWKAQKRFILSATAIVGITFLLILLSRQDTAAWNTLEGWFANLIDPLFGVTTVLIALAIWYFETREAWGNSLPKKLSVAFLHEGKLKMYAHKISLQSEGDLRAMAQSTGAQIMKARFLNLSPYIKFRTQQEEDQSEGKIRHFIVIYTLRELSTEMQGQKCKIWVKGANDLPREYEYEAQELEAALGASLGKKEGSNDALLQECLGVIATIV